MIKKFLLAVMLIWCAADGMAQERTLVIENYEDDDFYKKTTAVCDLYSDGTAVLKQYQSSDCDYTVSLPTTVSYKEKDYIIEEIADNVFFNDKINDYTINNETWLVTIPDNASSSLKLGATPFGNLRPPSGIELQVSPCVDASNWKEYFSVVQSIPLVDATFETLETTYEGNKPISLSTPCTVSTSDYTLSITKLQPLNDKGEFWSISAIDFTVIDINNNNTQVCQVKGGNLEIDKEILKVNLADITEITKENLLLETSSKFYPVPTNPDDIVSHVRTGGKPETYSDDYVLCEDNGKKFIPIRGLAETDTLCVECDYNFVCNENGVAVNFSIPSNANIKSNYGPGFHFSSHHYNWTLKLDQDYNCTIPLTDPYPVFVNTTPEDKYEEITGKEPINLSTQKWTDYWFEVDGKRYEHGFFINYNEEDFDYLTKSYDGSTSIEVKGTITLKLKQRFNPTIGAVNRMNSGWLAFDPEAYCIDIETIPITYSIAFDDASAGTNKGITLTITPKDSFYKALLGTNNKITLKGTITPMQLSEKDIVEIEKLIKNALEPTKIEDGESDINFSPKELTYETEKYKVNVTINEAKYLMSEKEVSTPGIGYDMKVTYEVDHNFCFGSTQTGYKYTNSVTFNGEGEITPSPSVSDDDFATAFKAKYKNYLSKTYDGTTNFLGFNPQDNVLSVTIGSATDAVAAQIKITSVAYDEKNAGSRSLKVECTPVQGSPYTISSPVTITGDDIKITPFVLDNIADYVKEDEHYKKDKTYNGYPDVEMNTPAFTIPGVTVNGTRETVEGTIAEAIYNKDGAAVSAVGDDYTITATLSIHVDDNYCFGKDNSGNYIYDNTYNIGTGSINPAKLDITFTPEDLDGKVSLTRKYNSEDASADILQSTVTKNDHTFEITSAIFTDNTPGTNKQIAITINLKDNNPNYTFDPTTVTITGGTIEKNNDEPEKIVIDKESIQQQTDQPAYCMEGVDGLTIKFAKLSGEKIKRFKIEIKGEEKLSEYMSSESEGAIPGDTIIYVHIPSDAKSGQYSGTIQFFDESGETSDKYDFTITVYKPSSMVKYLYHNVIFVDNHENLFSDYQWYKNGEKIDGATRQYYYEKVLNGNYYVVCKTNSGIKIKSCPVDGDLSAKISISSVKVYPNPAQANIPFNLELVGGNGNYSGAEMLIYNNSGNLVKHITNITDIITLTLPQGNYSGALFFNGEKTGFKIIVK